MLSRSSIFHSMREFRSSFTFYFSQSKLVASHNEMPNQFYLQIFSSSRQCFTRFFTFENVSVAWKRFVSLTDSSTRRFQIFIHSSTSRVVHVARRNFAFPVNCRIRICNRADSFSSNFN